MASSAGPERALDLNYATYWGTLNVAGPWWWQYTFPAGQEADVVGFSITPYSTGGAQPRDFTLQYSDNGTTWTTLITVTGNARLSGLSSGAIRG